MATIDQWISAIGTAGATLLAAGAIAIQQRDRRRAQAESLSVWVTTKETDMVRGTLHIVNGGKGAVSDVVARAVAGDHTTREVWTAGTIGPGSSNDITGEQDWGDAIDVNIPPRVEAYFHDAAGRHWHHRLNGSIKRVWFPKSAFGRYMKWGQIHHDEQRIIREHYGIPEQEVEYEEIELNDPDNSDGEGTAS